MDRVLGWDPHRDRTDRRTQPQHCAVPAPRAVALGFSNQQGGSSQRSVVEAITFLDFDPEAQNRGVYTRG